jgi:hypothetical protein
VKKNYSRQKFEIFTVVESDKVSKMAVVRVMTPCSLGLLYTDDICGALSFRNVMSAGLNVAKSQRIVSFTVSSMKSRISQIKVQFFLIDFCFLLLYIYIPYFLVDNAHLMYNAQPKLFRHSF